MAERPILLWLRRDLRLHDHPAMDFAAGSGRPVIPVFIHDETVADLGAAARWRMGRAVASFAQRLEGIGSRLILRRGPALAVLRALVAETGAGAVCWSRLYDPASQARDSAVKAALRDEGLRAESFPGHLLFEPWRVETATGGPYRVFTPYWRALKGRNPRPGVHTVSALRPPTKWPESENLERWQMGTAMNRGAAIVERHARIGEVAALARLDAFLEAGIGEYRQRRDFPAEPATSGLSENLTYGEISALAIWQAGWRRLEEGAQGAETFLQELAWREFAWHLFYHFPQLDRQNWRSEWDGFPWRGDNDDAEAWRRGMTGEPFVDAAMRQMYVTGTMHNRARMIAASYLTKHLLTDWRVGLGWFAECLTDWDPAANAMGWQWVAGSGPDAAPYFRVFNPETQAKKFDMKGAYRAKFIAEGARASAPDALQFFAACPRAWGLSAGQPYPERRIGLDEGRRRALSAYENRVR
ncbi:MAG: deoxyribodipyrimidine photo-lyase [Rhodobacteraceae bacterium]|nr:deoxyribodipyrimidine photo-lyase [Paracoccaceae bacterium]